MKHLNSTDIIGATFGASIVAIKNVYLTIIAKSSVDWMIILETIVLSSLGALVGFIVTEIARWAKRKIVAKWFKDTTK